ncbi:hypothetical protein D9611_011170 [Ephemerocybe angulata]|uniref:Uncharacterized protein n=1 Tax=Ephemerocybe angulata TaxID=980116 RepID=A0A8H5CDK6_9AGAR|nr:hypothetical protein D9611_011170 [Tulosesus angulatus]
MSLGRDNTARVLENFELTSLIFQCLKETTLAEANIEITPDKVPAFPTSWTAPWARLALVNRAFFNASTGVLWEHLSTFEPALRLLNASVTDSLGESWCPESNLNAISSKEWDRFKLYSSKTRSLAFKTPIYPIGLPWILQLTTSKQRPDPLFPALSRLFVNSSDDMSLFVTFSVAHLVKIVIVDFENPVVSESTLAITSYMSQRECFTKCLRLEQPCSPLIISNVSKITSLTRLDLMLNGLDDVQLWRLDNLASLEKFKLTIQHPEDYHHPPAFSTVIQALTVRKTSFQKLKELYIKASGVEHLQVAASILPSGLEILILGMAPGTPGEQALLMPLAATTYAKRNPSLKILVVGAPSAFVIPHAAIEPARGDPKYANYEAFLSSLGTLTSLENLRINYIPFFDVDINHRLGEVACRLPRLKNLFLYPRPVSSRAPDQLATFGLPVLQDLAKSCRHLATIELVVDYSDIPPIPSNSPPLDTLKRIVFRDTVHLPGLQKPTSTTKLELVQYLHCLFPQLETLAEGWKRDSEPWQYWTEIEQLLAFSRNLRSQLVQDLANTANTPQANS